MTQHSGMAASLPRSSLQADGPQSRVLPAASLAGTQVGPKGDVTGAGGGRQATLARKRHSPSSIACESIAVDVEVVDEADPWANTEDAPARASRTPQARCLRAIRMTPQQREEARRYGQRVWSDLSPQNASNADEMRANHVVLGRLSPCRIIRRARGEDLMGPCPSLPGHTTIKSCLQQNIS